jgi:hypothetical protein
MPPRRRRAFDGHRRSWHTDDDRQRGSRETPDWMSTTGIRVSGKRRSAQCGWTGHAVGSVRPNHQRCLHPSALPSALVSGSAGAIHGGRDAGQQWHVVVRILGACGADCMRDAILDRSTMRSRRHVLDCADGARGMQKSARARWPSKSAGWRKWQR